MGQSEGSPEHTLTRYRTIVVDPPWPYGMGNRPGWSWREGRSSGDARPLDYPEMSLEEIAALPVRAWSDNLDGDSHLYLWTTSRYLPDSFSIARRWGFHYAATLVRCKQSRGFSVGGAFQNNVEFVLFCRRPGFSRRPDILKLTSALADAAERGGLTRRDVDEYMGTSDMAGWWLSRIEHRCSCPSDEHWPRLKRLLCLDDDLDPLVAEINAGKGERRAPAIEQATSRWFAWPRTEHSAKPEAFLDIVEQVSPGPYAELFARRARLGWSYPLGDQALGGEAVQLTSRGQSDG